MPSFQTAVAVLGVLLIVGALASDLAQRSILSLAILFALAGFAVGNGGFGWLDFGAHSSFVEDLAFAALIVILFRDGLEVEGEMLQRAWHLPLRKLALAMPITAAIVAAAGHLLIGLSWSESFLLGALLAPTDPILTSSIVTNSRVPRLVRHSLNLESGLNDGLALPAVLAFLAALSTTSGHFVWWHFVIEDVGLGLLYGLLCGWLASLLLPRERESAMKRVEGEHGAVQRVQLERDAVDPERSADVAPIGFSHQKSLFALGVAFATYGLTVLAPTGNGFIAVFVAAIVLGVRRPEMRVHFQRGADEIVELLKLGVFLVFGSLLTVHALTREGIAAVGFVAITFLIARPLAVWLALLGTPTGRSTRLFMGWFGPKGIATMTFSLLVLHQGIPSGARIFDLTALVVFCSIILHGLTDTPGANWIAARSEEVSEPAGRAKALEPQE